MLSIAYFSSFPFLTSNFWQYARIVREALCELELPYILQNVGQGSLRSKLLVDASGSKEVRVTSVCWFRKFLVLLNLIEIYSA